MKNLIIPFLLITIFSSCDKITQKRLSGSWNLKEIKELPTENLNYWKNLLDTAQVKMVFYDEGSYKIFFFEDNVLTDFTAGTYLLSENEGNLVIDGKNEIFNTHGHALKVTSLRRNAMTLEGRYYLEFYQQLPVDTFATLRWEFEK